MRKEVTAAEALAMLTRTTMRPFTQDDWYGFAGCTSDTPMIGECDECILIVDGEGLSIIRDDDGSEQMFRLSAC